MVTRRAEPPRPGAITPDQVLAVKGRSIRPEYQAFVRDPQILGLMVSHYFEWDIGEIFQAFVYALEDANGHAENRELVKMFPELVPPEFVKD